MNSLIINMSNQNLVISPQLTSNCQYH